MKLKRFAVVLSILLLVTFVFTACNKTQDSSGKGNENNTTTQGSQDNAQGDTNSSNAGSSEPVTLTVQTNLVGEHAKILEDMMKAYSQTHTNVTIDFSAPGKEYENMMKVKMASNDMPDMFSTHGWSKIRYGNYLANLSGRAWASKIVDSFKPVVSDDTGKVYVLAFDQDKSGPIYNPAIFEEYGVEVPKTFDEFMEACETIKTKSGGKVTPIGCAAENWEEAQFFDFFATALLISPAENYASQLLDGTFDWTKWDLLAEKWLEMYQKGYINKDMLTAKYDDNAKAFAEGKIAIAFYGPYFIEEARKINPDVAADMMPIPAMVEGDTPTFAGGEKSTIGVWKDSKYLETAMDVVDFCAQPENVQKMCEFTKLPPAIEGVTADLGELTGTYEKYKDIRTFEYFDRVYLPNGMWDVMCKNSQSLIGGKITPRQFSENMQKEYERLRKAQE